MNPRASALWLKFKAHRLASTLAVLLTLAVGILIGTVVSYGVKGQDSKTNVSADATPLQVPSPQQLSNSFTKVAKQLEPSVVNINTEATLEAPTAHKRGGPGQGRGQSPDQETPFDDFFDRF